MPSGVYNKFKLNQLTGGANSVDFDTDSLKVMLLKSTYTPDFDADDFLNDVRAQEVSVSGYTAGGATLASVAVSQDSTNDWINVDAADPTWSIPSGATLTCRYGVIYKVVGTTDAASPLIALIDFGKDQVTVGPNPFQIKWGDPRFLCLG